jgi:hypothetical protein
VIETKADARGVEVEAVVLLGLEDLVCSATASGSVCVVRRLAVSMGQRRASVNDDVLALAYRCIVVRFGLIYLNMRRLLLILIYAGTLLMFLGFQKYAITFSEFWFTLWPM